MSTPTASGEPAGSRPRTVETAGAGNPFIPFPTDGSVSGAMLVAAIRKRAGEIGLTVKDFAKPLAPYPDSYLWHVGRADRPIPGTVERVNALLAGKPIPARSRRQTPRPPALPPVASPIRQHVMAPREPDMLRDPCMRCGTRYDLHDKLGCRRWEPRRL